MDVAKKVAQLIHDKRDEEARKKQIEESFPLKKKMLEEKLKSYFDLFYNRVAGFVNEGTYFERQVNEAQNSLENSSVYLYGEKLIYLSFVENPEEENIFYKVIVKVDDSSFGDEKYELKVKYNDGKFSWYNGNIELTSDTFDKFMDEVILGLPF